MVSGTDTSPICPSAQHFYSHFCLFTGLRRTIPAAALCVLITLLMSSQVELIWKRRWGIAKIIYLWNRYFSLVTISLNASGAL
ncbi:hypothetical protein B0H10DRAFT_2052717 [Mycena sp. CBHHK59/15]|nr:hypothetical protein B0H10DRAFT_2052717 [Mycena sp. CBHHK59/15]